MNKSIMIVGVGGQGTLLASRILGAALLDCGYDVKVSEVHGMSQRGGSVVTYVKFGESIASPIIEKGEADIILAFEKLEAARWLEYLKPDGKIIVNTQQIDPMPVVMGSTEYPDGIIEALKADYSGYKALNKKEVLNTLLTAVSNGLLEEASFELDESSEIRIYFRSNAEGIATINSYIR